MMKPKPKPTPGQSKSRNVDSDCDRDSDRDRDSDLQWLAFCYVSAELDEAAREAFDQRLASDLEAQEMLASVVALGRGVFEVESELQSSPTDRPMPMQVQMPIAVVDALPSSRLWSILSVAAAVMVIVSVGYGIARYQSHGHPLTAQTNQIASVQSPPEAMTAGGLLLDQWIENLDSTDAENGGNPNAPDQQTAAVLWEDDTTEGNDPWIESNQSEWNIDVSMVAIYSDAFDGLDESHLLELKSSQQRSGVIQ